MSRVRLGWRFAALEAESEPDAEGRVTCTIRADSLDMAVECVLSLAGQAEIIEPLELRDRVAVAARAAFG
jgi:predicted DNA-binding transcriptional regulator YafY